MTFRLRPLSPTERVEMLTELEQLGERHARLRADADQLQRLAAEGERRFGHPPPADLQDRIAETTRLVAELEAMLLEMQQAAVADENE